MVNQIEDMDAFPMKPPMMRKSCLLPGELPRIAHLTVDCVMEICKGVVIHFVEFLWYAYLSIVTWNNLSPASPQGEDGIYRQDPPLWKTYPTKV